MDGKREHRSSRQQHEEWTADSNNRRISPGKVTLTSRLPPTTSDTVQPKTVAAETDTPRPEVKTAWEWTNNPWLDAVHRGTTLPELAVQKTAISSTATRSAESAQAEQSAVATGDSDRVHRVAEAGVSSSGGALPHIERIQPSFGPDYDVSHIEAHVGGIAAAASEAMGASAYATGHRVAFQSTPDVHTAAHEAAHVIQQQQGVQLQGGVGQVGDVYERHADAVADRVVAGQSATDLLAAGPTAAPETEPVGPRQGGVQRQAVQFWSGHEHRAMGNMAAIFATGDANFSVQQYIDDFKAKLGGGENATDPAERRSAIAAGGVTPLQGPETRSVPGHFVHGAEQSSDPALVALEREGATKVRVRTNDTIYRNPRTGALRRMQNDISFGAASEFSGDYTETPEELARVRNSDNPTGNDFVTMALIAETNINHFYPLTQAEYTKHHNAALAAADAGDRRKALLEEGFASHFLEDCFAAGHQAPRGLDRTTLSKMEEGELGLNRTKSWHDALNAVPGPGLPTTRGRFHGDDTMTGNDLTTIAVDVGKSLKQVLDRLAGIPNNTQINLPAPDHTQIMADPRYSVIWSRMMGDYEQDLRDAEAGRGPASVTTDGGTSMNSRAMAELIRTNVYGGQRQRLLRLGDTEWNGATLVFNLFEEGRAAPMWTENDQGQRQRTTVYVQWFNKDLGYDRSEHGYETGTATSSNGAELGNTDAKIGALQSIHLTEDGIGSARAPEDNTDDSYAVFYVDQNCTVPIGRSNVQGQNRGTVAKPMQVSGFRWSDTHLSFLITRGVEPVTGRSIYLRWYNQDAGADRDSSGNLGQSVIDTDAQIGNTLTLPVVDGQVQVTATGDADNPDDTYATIYLDRECMIPLGRSPLQR